MVILNSYVKLPEVKINDRDPLEISREKTDRKAATTKMELTREQWAYGHHGFLAVSNPNWN